MKKNISIEKSYEYHQEQRLWLIAIASLSNGFIGFQAILASAKQGCWWLTVFSICALAVAMMMHFMMPASFTATHIIACYEEASGCQQLICQKAWQHYAQFEPRASLTANIACVTAAIVILSSYLYFLLAPWVPAWFLLLETFVNIFITLVINFICLLMYMVIYYEDQQLPDDYWLSK